MKKNKLEFLLLILLVITVRAQSQTYAVVNLDTMTYYGTTDTLDYMPINISTSGNVIVSGNQKMSATQYDAMMAEQTESGVGVWLSSFNTSNQKAFITSSTTDGMGNVYSAGAIRTATSNGTDYLVMKRNGAGTLLWSYYYDGPGNGNDIATSICLDPSGNVYVTGSSDGTFPALADFATMRINKTTGAQVWLTRYNYANSFDVATKIAYNNIGGGQVIVTGSSGNSFTTYDIATAKYNPNTGAQISTVIRNSSTGAGEDKPFGLVTDTLGNIYFVGTDYSGGQYNGRVTKLDTSFATIWTHTIDLHGLDDAALGLGIDDSLNVFVVGTSYYSATNKELFLAKYNSAGIRKWLVHRKAEAKSLSDAEGIRIVVKNRNEIFVGANFKINGNQDIALLRYDQYGRQTLERTYNAASNGKDQFMDMTLAGNKIFVSGRSFNGTDDDNIVLHYSYADLSVVPVTNTITNAHYVKNEVILRFHKSALKMSAINDKNLLFGELSAFVKDSTCNKIQTLLDPIREYGLNAKKLSARKLNPTFTEPDSLSLSRLGDYVRIPQVYASIIITLPNAINTENAALNVGNIKPDICWSQLNNFYTFDWVPNDSLYQAKQTSLHTSTLYPNAHINVEKAWDYTQGKLHVRTGVFDTGLEPGSNPDLLSQNMTESHSFMYPNAGTYCPDYMGHGTQVAGIIGATTDNTSGVAGIAAGGNGDPGVNVVIMKIGDNVLATDANIKNSYMIGASGSNILNCAALHIMSNSYGRKNVSKSAELIEGVEYVNQNGVAFVASRGNYVTTNTLFPINSSNQPATNLPRITMNVGASGENGDNHVNGSNGSQFTTFRGKNIDFMAPGAINNVYTPYNYYSGPPALPPSNTYSAFGGTSSAAPHVSGVISLMMSYRNLTYSNWDNLAHEDCEALLKRSATDATAAASPYFQGIGYDTISGYGKINADSALSCLQPKYKIRHIDLTHHTTSSSTSTAVIATNVVRYWPGSAVYSAGTYSVDIIEYTATYNYNYGSEIFIDAWPLYKASNGHPNATLTDISDENYYSEIVSATTNSAVVKTYTYKFNFKATPPYSNLGGQVNPQVNALKAAFTLYTLGDPLTSIKDNGDKGSEVNTSYFNVYPNPNSGNFNVGFSSKVESKGVLKLVNVIGTIMYEDSSIQIKQGINRFEVSINNLPKGIYFVNLDIQNNKSLVRKIVIN